MHPASRMGTQSKKATALGVLKLRAHGVNYILSTGHPDSKNGSKNDSKPERVVGISAGRVPVSGGMTKQNDNPVALLQTLISAAPILLGP